MRNKGKHLHLTAEGCFKKAISEFYLDRKQIKQVKFHKKQTKLY